MHTAAVWDKMGASSPPLFTTSSEHPERGIQFFPNFDAHRDTVHRALLFYRASEILANGFLVALLHFPMVQYMGGGQTQIISLPQFEDL